MWVTLSNFCLELLERGVTLIDNGREVAPRGTLWACVAYSPSNSILIGEASASSELCDIDKELVEEVCIV